ncbi:MAG: hypothetical protein ABSF62_23200, partial [Bryobacteraceae bacterium]
MEQIFQPATPTFLSARVRQPSSHAPGIGFVPSNPPFFQSHTKITSYGKLASFGQTAPWDRPPGLSIPVKLGRASGAPTPVHSQPLLQLGSFRQTHLSSKPKEKSPVTENWLR